MERFFNVKLEVQLSKDKEPMSEMLVAARIHEALQGLGGMQVLTAAAEEVTKLECWKLGEAEEKEA
jgi:hypothetical protein